MMTLSNMDAPVIAKLGGPEKVRLMLHAAGYSTPSSTIYRWRARGRVSGKAQLLLMERAAALGIAVAPGDFRSRPACDGAGGDGRGDNDSSDATGCGGDGAADGGAEREDAA